MISNSSISVLVRTLASLGVALAAGLLIAASPGVASARHGAHLVIVSMTPPPPALVTGAAFSERFREANHGDRRAPASRTGFYLSPSRRLGRESIPLAGTASVPKLKPGMKVVAGTQLTVPANTPQASYLLLGCANAGHKAQKRRSQSYCRVAKGSVTITMGSLGGGSSSISEAGCIGTREPSITSTDQRCFDGDPENGVFVSGLGDDANPGTKAAPKRTLAAGIAAATGHERDVYVTEGVFPETLVVNDGVSVFGGYDSSWQRSPSNITKITGLGASSDSALASGIDKPTTLQLLRLAPSAPAVPGQSSYGVRGLNSPGLVLDHDTIIAAAGSAGGAGGNGATGATGGEGHPDGGAGGSSASGHTGGEGGAGGYDGESGHEGEAGKATEPDQWGAMGGPGGPGGEGSSNPKSGGPGNAGDAGHRGSDGSGGGNGNAAPGSGLWRTESGQSGQSGTAGHGGGGGGGGGSDGCTFGYRADGGGGGGGGGGGSGGGGGGGGEGGGGSFGVYLEASSGAMVRDSSVTSSDGGTGGNGGSGGYAGAGGVGAEETAGFPGSGLCSAGAAAGAKGGVGGPGGLGGNGGGGAGGPSVAIFGLSASAAPGTTVGHGKGGSGSPGPGGGGATGIATDYQ